MLALLVSLLVLSPPSAPAQEAASGSAPLEVGLATGPLSAAAEEDPLGGADPLAGEVTLEEVLTRARARNPRVGAVGSLAEAASVRRSWAGLPPDPAIQLGVMNFSLPGFDADMPNSMAPAIQVSQMIPFPGKLGLESRIAEASADMALAVADETWLEVRARVVGAFYELHAVDERLEVMRRTKALLEDFQTAARALYAAGAGRQTDVLQANVEIARMDAEIASEEAMRRVVAARLNALLDRPAEAPVGSPALGELPADLPAPGALRQWAAESRPALRRERLRVERAEAALARARKEIWPDLMLGVQYGQRRTQLDETERMGSVMLGFNLPLFAGRRQLKYRDEAAAMESMARAELAEVRAEVDAEVEEHRAEMERMRTLLTLYRDEVLPQARAAVESAFSSYRVGAVDFMTLVEAQMIVNRFEGEFHTLMAGYGTHVAELEAAVGRPLPPSEPLRMEGP